ncbi:MAG: lyase [Acidimicrobiaceae bacterium]|jgi:formamidopyrimidine-DNA glycosylase|nr:lyase [Acidimicrobiaceae bacterium]
MPELPEMQALAERLGPLLSGARPSVVAALGFSALKTVSPRPDDLVGRRVTAVGRRGKYLLTELEGGLRLLVHLGQAGRLDVEQPPKATKPRGAVVRVTFDSGIAILVREFGTERKAAWWVLGPGDDGPLAGLGPEAGSDDFGELVMTTDSGQRLHTWLRDQHVVAGLGRGYADDVLNRARLSPFASPGSLDTDERQRLLGSVRYVLAEALARERERTGGLSEARLGERFAVHNRKGEPCPNCGSPLSAISYASYEIDYCSTCQTGGRVLADRRMSRLLR